MHRTFAVVLFLGIVALSVPAFAEPNMQDGKWEITTKMEMQGMPDMPMTIPPVTVTQCLSKKEMVPQKAGKNEECKMVSNKVEGNTVTWVMECKMKDGTTSESVGKITYSGARFDGVINTTMKESRDSGPTKVTQKMTGKRIGDCQ